MKKESLVSSMPHSEVTATLEGLGCEGVTQRHLTAIRAGGRDAMSIVARAIKNASKLSVSIEVAREIMGNNFFYMDDVALMLNVGFRHIDDESLEDVPFSREVLECYKDTHVLFPLIPAEVFLIASFARIIDHIDEETTTATRATFNRFHSLKSLKRAARWHLVSKNPEKDSLGKTFIQQVKLLPKGSDMAKVRELVFLFSLMPSLLHSIKGQCIRCFDSHLDNIEEDAVIEGLEDSVSRFEIIVYRTSDTIEVSSTQDEDVDSTFYTSVRPCV